MNKKVALVLTAVVVLALYPGGEARDCPGATEFPVCAIREEDRLQGRGNDALRRAAQTMFFTDRPDRVVGNVPTDKFVAKWTTDKGPNGFATNPPNAAVTVFQPDGAKTAIVELTNPRLDGNKLSYNVKVLQGIASAQLAEGVLFIDNYTGWAANVFNADLY